MCGEFNTPGQFRYIYIGDLSKSIGFKITCAASSKYRAETYAPFNEPGLEIRSARINLPRSATNVHVSSFVKGSLISSPDRVKSCYIEFRSRKYPNSDPRRETY